MTVRQPRAHLTLNGQDVPIIDWSVTQNRHATADTFRATIAMATSSLTISDFASMGNIDVTLMASNDGSDYVKMFEGQIDRSCVIIGAKGYVAQVSGRDKVGKAIDATRTEKHADKKPREIIEELAGKHGLSVEFGSSDSGGGDDKAGKVHTEQHAHLIDNDSDWNTICRLAEREGFLPPYAKGSKLYLDGPDDQGDGDYTIRVTPPTPGRPAQGDIVQIQFTNNSHLGKDLTQTVRSSNTRKAKSISKSKTLKVGEATRDAQSKPLKWERHEPGLTDDQVDKIAKKLLEEKSRHELNVDIGMPGDVNLHPRLMIRITGTGSGFDQSYFIDSVTHGCDVASGYRMDIRAKNKREGRSIQDGGDDTSSDEGGGEGGGGTQ